MFRLPLRRLSAFTLLELVVVLVVSAILFNLAYAALGMVQHQQQVIASHTAALGQLSTWQEVLGADFQAARRVEVAGDQLRCEREAGSVIYAWQDSVLVRQQGEAVDSFSLPVREHTCFWQGKPRTQGLIDEISLTIMTARDTFYLQAAAQYDARQLLSEPQATPSL